MYLEKLEDMFFVAVLAGKKQERTGELPDQVVLYTQVF